MSGGSWDGVFGRLVDVAEALHRDRATHTGPLDLNEEQREWRHRLARHLEAVAQALYAVEMVDSYDMSYPADVEAIRRVLGEGGGG